MENLTDEALVAMYKAGNEEAMNILLKKYKAVIKNKAKALFIMGGDSDDLIQEGMIGLYKAVIGYSSDKETTFYTFASMCVNRQMLTAIEAANRKKNRPLNGSISFETMLGSDDQEDNTTLGELLQASNVNNPETMLMDKEQYKDLLGRINAKLSDYEKRVLKLHMSGLGYTEIASELHKSPKSIDNALQRIKAKITAVVK